MKKVETAKNNAIEIKKKEALSGSKQSEIPVDNYAEARKEFEAAVKASNEAVKAAEKVGNATSDVTNKVKNEIKCDQSGGSFCCNFSFKQSGKFADRTTNKPIKSDSLT